MTRETLQTILETNSLNAKVYYMEREPQDTSDDKNVIIYYRLSSSNRMYGDDKLQARNCLIQISHYHRQKLDSIEDLIAKNFNVLPETYQFKDENSDFWQTIYRFETLIEGSW